MYDARSHLYQIKLDVCTKIKNYNIATYNFLTIFNENAVTNDAAVFFQYIIL